MSEGLTTPEAAALLGVVRTTILRRALAGDLPGWRDEHRRWRFAEADLLALAPRLERRRKGCSGRACPHRHAARGWCKGHLARLVRTGDARPDVPVGEGRRRVRPAMPRVPVPVPVWMRPRAFDPVDTGEL